MEVTIRPSRAIRLATLVSEAHVVGPIPTMTLAILQGDHLDTRRQIALAPAIALGQLPRCETANYDIDLLDRLLMLVKAVRGTNHWVPIGEVLSRRSIYLQLEIESNLEPAGRLILGNLVLKKSWFDSARGTSTSKQGMPVHSFERFRGLASVVDRAYAVSRIRSKDSTKVSLSILRRTFNSASLDTNTCSALC